MKFCATQTLLFHLVASLAALQACMEPSKAYSPTLLRWDNVPETEESPNLNSPIVTDRPDFTEASSTVGLGVAQLEVGYTYTLDNDQSNSVQSHSYPEPLLRFGMLAEWLEFRVGWNYAGEDDGFLETSGAEDLYLGFKIGLTPQAGFLPEMALIPQTTVPTGHHAYTADEVLPGMNWIYG